MEPVSNNLVTNVPHFAVGISNALSNTSSLSSAALPPLWTAWIVFLAALVATFIASVMANEQDERLRNGTFGAIAGTSIGGLAALITSRHDLVILGFFGSAVGAVIGWGVILYLSRVARTPEGRDWLEYYVGGFKALRERIDLDDRQTLLSALAKWRVSFSKMIDEEKNEILALPHDANADFATKLVIRDWLVSSTEFFGLVFETFAKRPEYRSRTALIIFGMQNRNIRGRIWLSHIGSLHAYRPVDFDETSIAYKVAAGEIESPHFTTKEEAKQKGQERGREKYRPFYTYKLHKCAVLVIDWPDDLPESDPYVEVAIDVFRRDIGPAIEALLHHSSVPPSKLVNLDPLPESK